ncbi:uncharacterized protein PV09_09066 [Verruconis gallopava]|uniref:RNA helicase n=1 Tax=Verruconis gallopava TaxID=253628 RepID=A0A0D1ZXL7_9PEZI|nr:uncharacterized protein PV09_09066 [Verruconis gallopava]KIV99202.1 hypothetical protein PV09_09066 [Verruconis gallopava]
MASLRASVAEARISNQAYNHQMRADTSFRRTQGLVMPAIHSQPWQCIFCASGLHHLSRARQSRLPQHIVEQYGSFSTASRVQRTASVVRKMYGRSADWTASNRPLFRRVKANSKEVKGYEQVAYKMLRKNRFKRIVLDRLDAIESKLKESPIFQLPGLNSDQVDKALAQFRWYVRESIGNDTRGSKFSSVHDLQSKLFGAMKDNGQSGLDSELQYALYNHFLGRNFSAEDIENQKALADLRYPTEWFPLPRAMHRTIHAHIGPTNSGKTHHALKRLEQASAGLYAGPLRLLAHEVYSRLNAKGKPCALVTGEEQRLPDGWNSATAKVISATVEMTNLNSQYDVAVIDEIQMLGSLERGFAWTQALLGLQAKEIHVCGEVRALPIIRELAAAAGDTLVVHEYDRLTSLKMDQRSLNGSFKDLRKGDCIVTFSVVNIHALRTEVEKKTGKKAAVVYGSLPPETRAQQARLFNDPNNDYDYLIASDAVGMGLNLSIKRIIFETVHKYQNGKYTTLTVSEIRQIAGRAGRYRTSQQSLKSAENENNADEVRESGRYDVFKTDLHLNAGESSLDDNSVGGNLDTITPLNAQLSSRAEFDPHTVGLVTTIDHADFGVVRSALETEPPELSFATLQPPPGIVQRFASYFPPGTPLSYILLRLGELSATSHRYRIFHKPDMIMMADLIHGIEGLSMEDRMIFINAPAAIREPTSSQAKLLKELAQCIGSQRGGELLALKHMNLDVLDESTEGSKTRLKNLEELHKGLVLYLWLSFRFPGVFTQRPLANYAKELVENEIEETLRLMTFSPNAIHRERIRKKSRVEDEIMRAIREEQALGGQIQVAEPGFRSSGAEDMMEPEMDNHQIVAKEGEKMPENEDCEYPNQEISAVESEAFESKRQRRAATLVLGTLS